MTPPKKLVLFFTLGVFIAICFTMLLYPWFIRNANNNSSYLCLNKLRWLQHEVFSTADGNFFALARRFSKKKVKIVSAEKVFAKLDPRLEWVEMSLVSDNYRRAVLPIHPKGKTYSDRWGSSFYSWGMPVEKWKATPAFRWNTLKFPLLWDKRPDLNDGKVNFLAVDDPFVETLPQKKFDKYLSAAKEWVEPDKVTLKELERRIEGGAPTSARSPS
ncbi:MAG: hypothetical protein GXP32_09360 [Kiritimatiellaeota bacterium]|nr:hypothetical protein [Kiritimatiellota bacterium]